MIVVETDGKYEVYLFFDRTGGRLLIDKLESLLAGPAPDHDHLAGVTPAQPYDELLVKKVSGRTECSVMEMLTLELVLS